MEGESEEYGGEDDLYRAEEEAPCGDGDERAGQ